MDKIAAWLLAFLAILAVGYGCNAPAPDLSDDDAKVYPSVPVNPDSPSYPLCEEEDGATQDTCTWHYTTSKGESRTLVNHNWGEWTYYPHTNSYITWDSEPTQDQVLAASR